MYQVIHKMTSSKSQSFLERRITAEGKIGSHKEITDKTCCVTNCIRNIQIHQLIFLQYKINPIMYAGC